MKCAFLLYISLFIFSNSLKADVLKGQWSGIARTESEQTRLSISISHVKNEPIASMNLVDLGVLAWPADSVVKTKDTLKVTFHADSGPQEMILRVDGESMTGIWHETNFDKPAIVALNKVVSQLPFNEKNMLIDGPAGKIGASLILPECPSGCPGVVFLHGSGTQPRDTNRFAAFELAKYGIASIIFDKRGVGESQGDLSSVTFESLAEDAIAVAEILRKQSNVTSVGFFGHSQGGWIAPLAAATWQHSAFTIISSAPAVSPAREAQWEVVRQLRALNLSNAYEAEVRELIQLWHAGIRSGDWSDFESALKLAKEKPWFDLLNFETFMNRPDQSLSDSYRNYMDYDPMPALISLKTPLLAILTSDDESIDALETKLILASLKERGNNITLKLYEGYDHGMHQLGAVNTPIRWPQYPSDYFSYQVKFIQDSVSTR
jgi:pimeloyl-ACP methyl ester carboxylesterase